MRFTARVLTARELTSRLKNSNSLTELRQHVTANHTIMDAVHDSVICVACGRFGSTDELVKNECREFYLLASGMWLQRRDGSMGKGAREIANILHAGAKLEINPSNDRLIQLLDEAVRMSHRFEAQGAVTSLWAAASLGVENVYVVNALAQACVDRVKDFNSQDAANSIWAIATIGLSNSKIITILSQACVDHIKDFKAQNASNALWAVAILGFSDPNVVTVLAKACVDRIQDMNAQNAANALWAIAKLNVIDLDIINALIKACIDRVRVFNAQEAANSLWSIAKLEIKDVSVIGILAQACVDRLQYLNAQNLCNSFWSVAVLRPYVTDSGIITSLTVAVSERYLSIDKYEHAFQCLQAHQSGLVLSDDAEQYFKSVVAFGKANDH